MLSGVSALHLSGADDHYLTSCGAPGFLLLLSPTPPGKPFLMSRMESWSSGLVTLGGPASQSSENCVFIQTLIHLFAYLLSSLPVPERI